MKTLSVLVGLTGALFLMGCQTPYSACPDGFSLDYHNSFGRNDGHEYTTGPTNFCAIQ